MDEKPNTYCHYCGWKLTEEINGDAVCPRDDCQFNKALGDAMKQQQQMETVKCMNCNGAGIQPWGNVCCMCGGNGVIQKRR